MLSWKSALVYLLTGLAVTDAFVGKVGSTSALQVPTFTSSSPWQQQRSSSTQLQVLTTDPDTMETARVAFYIWFFGASGGAGIARSSFPRMWDAWQYIQNLKGVGPTKGGETISLNPLCGYPQDLAIADIEEVINNPMSIAEIVEANPIEGNFLSRSGYLVWPAFQKANENANPLVVRAIFDSLNTSSDACNPGVAQQKIDSYKQDLNAFKTELLKSRLAGWSAIGVLLFLLALADWEAFVVHARQGWFPEWPGFDNLPGSLLDSETGFGAIPNYWIGETGRK